ncbi:hypothetical protein GCM10022631_11030 [Deinococcus rubellus]|uniref:hypothetical protein n=1 Tax=Deinococcus rubellus TaxID=1889240 RepID=UPI0031ED01A1
MIKDLYFFGCKTAGQALGHYLFLGNNQKHDNSKNSLDSGLLTLAGVPDRPGRGCFAQVGNLSIVTFWDRTGDPRPNSNSAFFAEGRYTAEELLSAAREHYPRIFGRFDFEIKLR